MTVSPGIDLVAVEDVRLALETHGERYLRRVFTAGEIAAAGGPATPDITVLALMLAAKEAAMKALRSDGDPLPWTDVEVAGPPGGPVELRLHGAAGQLAARHGTQGLSVSTTMEGHFAAAIVVAGEQRE